MSRQDDFFYLEPEDKKASGPVECLGMTFPNDEERRTYFLGILRKKLKDLEFRKIEGFPIGSDEDILALSDPPYYTACPNPFLPDFIRLYGKPYDPNWLSTGSMPEGDKPWHQNNGIGIGRVT